jgi:uncharacterized membrane protein
VVGLFELKGKSVSPASSAAQPVPPNSASAALAPGTADSAKRALWIAGLFFVLCLAAQFYLVLFKSFNWDEFLHFSQVYHLREGTEIQPFQTVHLRLLMWAPDVAADLLDQMRAARMFVWSMHLLTLFMIYGVAQNFTTGTNAFFASFAYLGAGFVFTHGFSIRGDPLVTAALMSALFLLAKDRLNLTRAIAVGALIGLAGMITFKAAFYAPCFAGLAWLKFRESPKKSQVPGKLAVLGITAVIAFGAIYVAHSWDFPKAAKPLGNTSFVSFYLRWLTIDMPFVGHVGREVLLAPLFFLLLIVSPRAWRTAGLNKDAQLALAGFIAPLATLIFYRNTFPYFFTFILAPVAVGIAPALGLVRDRFGSVFLAVLLSATPLALTVLEPRDVIRRQQALIDYVHQEFPERTGYLDYSGIISDYPRVFKFLTSGNGIRLYHEEGDPIIGREIDRGNVPFIIANQEVISTALENRPVAKTFLPADLAAMKGNYVRQWGVLWREGTDVPAGAGEFPFYLRRGGVFVLAGDTITLDGVTVRNGTTITLDKGPHLVSGSRQRASTLWRGRRLPASPPNIPMDYVFTNF